ncbi:MAG: hypothetical protein VW757_06650 [Halieaceae bacterium]
MTKKELNRINELLNEAAATRVQGDMATDRGDHDKALTFLDRENAAMVALYEEFGITDGAHKSRIEYSERRAAA